jgi:RNA polymerase sigma-70 factor (ECF subfamily)
VSCARQCQTAEIDPILVSVPTAPESERTAVSDRVPSGLSGGESDDGFTFMLLGARAGTPAACQALYESLAGRVCGYLRLRGATDPEDLTSEVFLRVFNHLDDFSCDARSLAAWVFTIAHRALVDERRRSARRPSTVELTDSMPETVARDAPENDALDGIAHDDLLTLLDRVTPDQRDVLALRIVADLPIRQVALVLNKSPGTVKALQHRGIAALRRQLGRSER